MGILNKAKLLLKKKFEMAKANAKFQLNLAREKLFFSIPSKIELLTIAALTILALIIKQILKQDIPKDEVKKFLRTDIRAKTILSFTANDIDETYVSEMILACYGELPIETIPEIDENLDVNEILKTISGLNDIDKKINFNKSRKLSQTISGNISKSNITKEQIKGQLIEIGIIAASVKMGYDIVKTGISNIDEQLTAEKESLKQEVETTQEKVQTYKYMLQHIVDTTKDLLTRTTHPSKYMTKYLEKLVRNTYALMKLEYEGLKGDVKKEYEKVLNALKQIDDILIAVTMMTSIYLINRLKLSQRSRASLKETLSDMKCPDDSTLFDVAEPFDVSVNKIPFEISLNCPAVIDDVVVPHVPITEKLKNLSCEVYQNEEMTVDASAKEDLATFAVVRNLRKKDTLTTSLSVDSFVDQKTKIATVGVTPVFSPVEGYVQDMNENEIILRDILDSTDDYLTSQIELLNTYYQELNEVKAFLKDYYVESLYPSMLATAIIDDSSTYDVDSGVEREWKKIRRDFKRINKDYEKQVKKITGKNNVESHAKNETLYKIKEELEAEQEKFYKNVHLAGITANNIAKITKAKSNEYELFEYYALDLSSIFIITEFSSQFEVDFKNAVQEFIRKRYIVDGYKKKKLENKIDSLIKEIESGLTTGNWFDKAMKIYKQRNSASDLEQWLSRMAFSNKKLEGSEKTSTVNRVLFLFDLYLNVDALTQKYNILQKETTSKKEAVKEGNVISLFILNLWKKYEELPQNIAKTEKTIENLSLFSTYSIIEYNEKQARLYTITDETACELTEPDPYLNPHSQYGYGDIQYWLRYCAGATLASVLNPATGWSTGWIVPSPILFPVVYIPLKPILTSFGFIVLGLSICGIYVFPWVLYTDYSTQFATPFADPTAFLKKEIQGLKAQISEQMSKLKRYAIKPLLEKAKIDVQNAQKEIEDIENSIIENKSLRPEKYDRDVNGNFIIVDNYLSVKLNMSYVEQYENWVKNSAALRELLVTAKIRLWRLEIVCSILQKLYDTGKSKKGVTDAVDASQKIIDDQLARLETLAENANKTLAALPIAIAPETANFGMTIKNPKPVIVITDEIDDNLNEEPLNKIAEKFRLKNSDFLSSKYDALLSNSIVNFKEYKRELSAAMPAIIKRDPFPKYELLTPMNIRWVEFLYKDFVTKGAQTYGFPGQLPIPLSV